MKNKQKIQDIQKKLRDLRNKDKNTSLFTSFFTTVCVLSAIVQMQWGWEQMELGLSVSAAFGVFFFSLFITGFYAGFYVVFSNHISDYDMDQLFATLLIPELQPSIIRKRLIIEGMPSKVISAESICNYLIQLGKLAEMTIVKYPTTHQSTQYGWAGWVHWENSGAHFYAWDSPLFFSVDIYTCKDFDTEQVVAFTKEDFQCEDAAIVYHEV